MEEARGKLGSSLTSIGGSSVARKWTFGALRKEVLKILAHKRQAVALFQDERIQELIEVCFQPKSLGEFAS